MVTVIVVLEPAATEAGLAAHVVEAADNEQLTATLPVKPLVPAMATVYVAELPEFTVTLLGAWGVMVKSGDVPPIPPVKLKFRTLLPPKAAGFASA